MCQAGVDIGPCHRDRRHSPTQVRALPHVPQPWRRAELQGGVRAPFGVLAPEAGPPQCRPPLLPPETTLLPWAGRWSGERGRFVFWGLTPRKCAAPRAAPGAGACPPGRCPAAGSRSPRPSRQPLQGEQGQRGGQDGLGGRSRRRRERPPLTQRHRGSTPHGEGPAPAGAHPVGPWRLAPALRPRSCQAPCCRPVLPQPGRRTRRAGLARCPLPSHTRTQMAQRGCRSQPAEARSQPGVWWSEPIPRGHGEPRAGEGVTSPPKQHARTGHRCTLAIF